MKALRITLTSLYALFAAIGIGLLFTEKASLGSLIITALYIAVALALNNKGGKVTKYLSYFTAGLLTLVILGSFYAAIAPLIGERFDIKLLVITFIIGVIGMSTLYVLIKQKKVVNS